VRWFNGPILATEVLIPSGETELVLALVGAQRGQIKYTGGQLITNYSFEKGHSYFLMIKQIINRGEVVITIKDKTAKTKTDVDAKARIINIRRPMAP
jgi:hypothetical protein